MRYEVVGNREYAKVSQYFIKYLLRLSILSTSFKLFLKLMQILSNKNPTRIKFRADYENEGLFRISQIYQKTFYN